LLWKQNVRNTALANPEIIATKNTHAKSKRIAVKVSKNKHDVNSKSKKIAVSRETRLRSLTRRTSTLGMPMLTTSLDKLLNNRT
jgi:hypothetical protein